MNKDLLIIKKKYGEKMAHFCRSSFSTLLEQEGLLSDILLSHFNENHYLYYDLVNYGMLQKFKDYIYKLGNKEENKKIVVNKDPEELMSDAGYILKECYTEEDIQSYKKYYAKNEELCTFLGDRLDTCRVFFAVKKNVSEIKRENFLNPLRQDEYGTSVISIQFTKDGSNTLSIKNRYNHTVDNPDATFSNDLDNIIAGLTNSFEIYYDIVQRNSDPTFEIPGYVKAKDGKYYKYNYEINNKYYCVDNIIIDNFRVMKFDKSRYLLLDYFLVDLVEKKIILYDIYLNDSFVDCIKNISKIEIINNDNGKTILFVSKDGVTLNIDVDKFNKMINLNMHGISSVGNKFLHRCDNLELIKSLDLKEVGNEFLYGGKMVDVIEIPELVIAGDAMLFSNERIEKVLFPKLECVGTDFFYWDDVITNINLENLKRVGSGFLAHYDDRDTLMDTLGIVVEKRRWRY